jgi:hypothetical protein
MKRPLRQGGSALVAVMVFVFNENDVPSWIISIHVFFHLLSACGNHFDSGLDRAEILVMAIQNDMELCSNFITFIHYGDRSLEQWQICCRSVYSLPSQGTV